MTGYASRKEDSMCFFFLHKWKPIRVYHYYDTSYDGIAESTNVLMKCSKCGRLKKREYYGVGFLTLEEVSK